MILTDKQAKGLAIAISRYCDGEKYTVISGYAGSGKSTLVKFIISCLQDYGVQESDVVHCAFTGKATQVLAKKGNKNCCTLHKLLFESIPKPDGTFLMVPVETIPYKVVVVDEVSMVDKELMDRLFSYDVYVICCGDPFQLPTISRKEAHTLLDHPHIFLDEIMRQAAESEIIWMTMKIRANEFIKPFQGEEVRIHKASELCTGMYSWADQILVGTNKTRAGINAEMREMLGMERDKPCHGDKVICGRNYWHIFDSNKDCLVNGTLGYLDNPALVARKLPAILGGQTIHAILTGIDIDTGAKLKRADLDLKLMTTEEKSLSDELIYKIYQINRKRRIFSVPLEFLYAYAMTIWRAQGSEWDKVLVIEESYPYDRETHAKALYTACTRASEKLVLVRKE